MFEIPPIGDWALVSTVVGAIFLVRFLLMVRRIRRAAGRDGTGSVWEDAGQVTTRLAFGPDLEPERRHAVRLFAVGAAFSAIGLALAGLSFVSGGLAQAGGLVS